MNFLSVKTNARNNLRSGWLKLMAASTDDNQHQHDSYRLPVCFQYTRDTCIPHLTWDLINNYIPDDNVPVTMSLAHVNSLQSVLQSSGLDLGSFLSTDYQHRPILLTVQDALGQSKMGYNSHSFVPLWTESGKKTIYPIDLVNCVKNVKPSSCQLLCDGETPKDAKSKRIDKSIRNTIHFTETCLALRDSDWANLPVFASIEGGWNQEKRLMAVDKMKSLSVDGFIIDGLTFQGLIDDSNENRKELQQILFNVCQGLPEDKPRALFGPLKPEMVIDAVKCGVDLFDSSYCTYLADSGRCISIEYASDSLEVASTLLDLNEDKFQRDFEVIELNCGCYSCSKGFSRGYIHHLLTASEMLAQVLIMLHNLHVYYNFFNHLSKYVETTEQSESS